MTDLDKFYTIDFIAEKCTYDALQYCYGGISTIIEPSAGDGVFIRALNKHGHNVIAYDVAPDNKGIIQQDWLTVKLNTKPENTLIIGNPPFGKRAKLAIDFFNHSSQYANTIAFIVPLQFRKFSVQNKLNVEFDLVYDNLLPKKSFIQDKKLKSLNTCFQIWMRRPIPYKLKNLRIINKPAIKHPDFKMWLYNNTPQALHVFNNQFDFAVPRQGYYDYNIKYNKEIMCDRKIQWLLFKAKNVEVLKRLKSIDFKKLSEKNTVIPGFGKADIVEEYIKLYGKS